MGESKYVIDLKRKELVEELKRPIRLQDKNKIRRLREDINRHRSWEKERTKAKRDRIESKNRKRIIRWK
jgi:hypothetical protein